MTYSREKLNICSFRYYCCSSSSPMLLKKNFGTVFYRRSRYICARQILENTLPVVANKIVECPRQLICLALNLLEISNGTLKLKNNTCRLKTARKSKHPTTFLLNNLCSSPFVPSTLYSVLTVDSTKMNSTSFCGKLYKLWFRIPLFWSIIKHSWRNSIFLTFYGNPYTVNYFVNLFGIQRLFIIQY